MDSARANPVVRRAAWSLADQLLSSGTNFLLLILVIRTSTGTEVGAFGLVYTSFFFLLATVRGVALEPLVVRYVGTRSSVWRSGTADASGMAVILGALAGAVIALVSLFFEGPAATAFRALALVVPVLLLQDSWRMAFFCQGRPQAACWNDTVFLQVQGLAYFVLFKFGHVSVSGLILLWGAGALAGAGLGVLQARTIPRPDRALCWFRAHKDIGIPFAGDSVVNRGAEQIAMAAIGALGGLATLGAVTTARSIFAPLTTIQAGLNTFALPEAARLNSKGRTGKVISLSWLLGAAMAIAMLLSGVALFLLPEDIGYTLLRHNWQAARDLLPIMTIFSAINALAYGLWIGLRAMQVARPLLNRRVCWGLILIGCSGLGAAQWGAAGAILGMTLAVFELSISLALLLNRHGPNQAADRRALASK